MWSVHFIINFEISLVNFLNVLGFLLLKSEKNGGDTFLIFLVINIYCFFDDHDAWLLLLEYFLWFVLMSAVLERLFKCYFAVPISLIRKARKETHTHTPDCFSLKNHGQSSFLKYLSLQFNFRINRGFYFFE